MPPIQIPPALQSVVTSRKAWQGAIAVTGAIAAKIWPLVPVILGLWGMPQAQVNQLLLDTSQLAALCVAAWGALMMAFTAAEDCARKWGITAPHPSETTPTTAILQQSNSGPVS